MKKAAVLISCLGLLVGQNAFASAPFFGGVCISPGSGKSMRQIEQEYTYCMNVARGSAQAENACAMAYAAELQALHPTIDQDCPGDQGVS